MADNINLRNIVLTMLTETLHKGVFSHIVVNDTFAAHEFSRQDRAFISRLYLGVLERLIYIDHLINRFSKTDTSRMKPVVLNILRLSVYQLLFMDSVPDHAAVNEASKLARKRGFSQLAPFINGVLRSIQREHETAEADMPANVRLSVPKWMYEMTAADYGEDAAVRFFEGTLNAEKKISIRLNPVKGSPEDMIREMENEGCVLEAVNRDDLCFRLSGFSGLTTLESYKKGLFSVQDVSSIKAAMTGARVLAEQKGIDSPGLIIDVCAAPGGKSICAAQHLPGMKVISRDLTQAKVDLIEENKKRLGLNNMEPQVHDALSFDENLKEMADMVIADLPCSGLGVIGGKPDIKFRVRQKDLVQLQQLQRDILSVVHGYVKPGGILVYSTCTINKGENSENALWFAENYGFKMLTEEQILGNDGDGFYIAVLKKQFHD